MKRLRDLLLILFASTISFSTFAQCIPNVGVTGQLGETADTIFTCVSFPLQFEDQSLVEGLLSVRSWDFGDGSGAIDGLLSSVQGYTYTTSGTFTMTLTVSSILCPPMIAKKVVVVLGQPPFTASAQNVSCNTSCDGKASVLISGTNAEYYNVNWNDPDAQATAIAVNLCPGSYFAVIWDDYGCTDITTNTVSVSVPAVLTASLDASSNADCNGSATGSASVSAFGGTAPYTFDIGAGPQADGNFSGLAAGSYTVTVLDGGCQTEIAQVVIDEPSALSASLDASSDADCNGNATGSASVSASGGTSPYTFDIGSGQQADGNFSGLAAGSYTVLVEDFNGCSTSVPVIIGQPAVLSASLDASADADCNGNATGSASVSASGGTSPYTFDIGSGSQADGNFSAVAAGSYTVLVEDFNGCQTSVPVVIDEPAALSASLDASADADCNGNATGSASVSASGGTAPYTFDIGSGPQADSNFSALAAGSYTVLVEDFHGCQTSFPVVIGEPSVLSASLDASSDADCNGNATGSASVTASGGTAPYTFDIGSGPQADDNFSALTAGSYTVLVEDFNGCQTSVPVVIGEPAVLSASLDASADADCNGNSTGSASVSASGGTSPYTFDIGNGQLADGNFSGLAAGSYTVLVEDFHGCQTSVPVFIDEPAVLEVAFAAGASISLCPSNGATQLDVVISGGTAPFASDWTSSPDLNVTSVTTAILNPTETSVNAQYDITVTDFNNCEASSAIVVSSTSSSLQGTLTMGNLPCIECEVFRFEHDALTPGVWNTIDSVMTDVVGHYDFGQVDNFQPFVLMGDPNELFYPMSVETFYPVEYNWNNATVFNMCGNDYVKDIVMIEPMQFNGSNTLSGTVWYDPSGKTETEEDPIPLIDVVVEKTPPGQAQGRVSTSTNGEYEFSFVPSSDTTYTIFVNIPGVPVMSTYEILANETGQVFDHLDFCVNIDWTEIQTCQVSQPIINETEEPYGGDFLLYPNPNNGMFTIETGKFAESNSEVRIVDTAGRVIFSKHYPETPYTINMVNVAEGFYLVQIMNERDSDSSPISIISR